MEVRGGGLACSEVLLNKQKTNSSFLPCLLTAEFKKKRKQHLAQERYEHLCERVCGAGGTRELKGTVEEIDGVKVGWQMERLPEKRLLGNILPSQNGRYPAHSDSCNNSSANILLGVNNKSPHRPSGSRKHGPRYPE